MKQLSKSKTEFNSLENNEKINKSTNFSLFSESEIVVKSILEKIISLSISQIYKSIIDNKVTSFCLLKIKKKIDTIISIQFINHDKDDLKQRKIIKNKSHKIILNIKNRNNIILTEEEIKNKKKLNKSQIIQHYELINDLNYFESFFDKKKTILNILKRKNEMENNFINKKIKNKNLIIGEENNFNNFWNTVFQPMNSKIDRDASTKLNVDNKLFKGKIFDCIPENINEEKQEKYDIKQTELNLKKVKNIKRYKKKIIEEEKPKKEKNKNLILIDLPSFNLEPGKFSNEDDESIKLLRKEYETELALKKEKVEREKKLKNKNNIIENKEDNGKKKDLNKGSNIIKIKHIKIENLITEFNSVKSHLKEIGKIPETNDVNAENITQNNNNSNNLIIEINENPNYQFDEETTERKKKKYYYRNNNNFIYNKKNKKEKEKESEMIEKNGAQYASGSNYDLIKLECGVNLIENRKKKSGGKNYFKKYGRFSYDLYKNKLYKTTTENFFENEEYKEIMNDSIKKDKINDDNKNNKIKDELISDKVLNREKSDLNDKYENTDIKMQLKTKIRNLKIVMNNLDLMKEFQLDIDQEKRNMKNTKYNFFKTKINKSIKRNEKDLREINNFNKTVMKNNLWGEPDILNKKEDILIKQPLFHNLKYNIRFPIIGQKRERLPPLSLFKAHQLNILKTKRNISFEKMKIRNLSKDNIYINENKSFYI